MCLFLILIGTAGTATAASTVVLGHDWCADALDLLVLFLDLLSIGLWVGVNPGLAILEGIKDHLLLIGVHLLAEALVVSGALSGRAHGVDVAIEGVLGIHTLLHLLVLISELLGLLDHLLDLLLSQAALVVGDSDLLTLARGLVLGTNVQDTVGVNLEGHLDLRLTAGSRRDSTKLELAQEVVV